MVRWTIIWALISTACLMLGYQRLAASSLALQRTQLERDATALRTLLEAQTWPEPIETSDKWQSLESDFSVDIVPTVVPGHDSAGSRDWMTRVAGQRIQASSTAELMTAGAESERVGAVRTTQLQIARQLTSLPLWPWLLFGGATMAFGAATLAASAAQSRFAERYRNEEVKAWVNLIARRTAETPTQLCKLSDPSELTSNLNIIAEHINATTSSLHNAKQRNELVLNNLREGVLAVDAQSRVLLVNSALDEHLQLASKNYLYRPLLEVVRAPQVIDIVQSVRNDNIAREEVVEILSTSRWLRISARPLPMKGETGVLLTTRDETLIKRIEAVRKDFIANASHELKTPLAAIRAYAETLQLGAIDDREAADNFIASIITQADRINGLIQGMLQLSRVESGSGLHIEQLDACEALQPVLAATQAMARSQDIELTWSPEAPALMIESDRNGFQTIASNLLSNAVRYTQPGGQVAVTLKACKLEDGRPACEFTVRDNGKGIQADDLERIFERFYRAEKDRSSDTGGTGLGLSIVKHLTNALGGTVTATSSPGKGSKFIVRLPVGSRCDS